MQSFKITDRNGGVRVLELPSANGGVIVGELTPGAALVPILTSDDVAVEVVGAPPALPAPPAPIKMKQVEVFPLGQIVEPGYPPAPRVLLTVPDSDPEPEPAKPKRKPKGAAA